jgi:hypothetical protein
MGGELILDLQFQGPEPLLQLHQALGQGGQGFRQPLSAAANPKGKGFRNHKNQKQTLGR